MQYDFDNTINRSFTNSIKWNKELIEKWLNIKETDMLSFWVADMDFKCAKPIIDITVKTAESGLYGYSDFTESYYNSVINWYKKRYSVSINQKWIVYSNGIVPSLNYIVQEFCKPGDKVLIQNPVYYPFTETILNNNLEVLDNTLKFTGESYEIDFIDLESKMKDERCKVMFLCNPHNPVGKVWSVECLSKILDICKRNNVLLVSDEIHSDIVYKDFKHTPIINFKEYHTNMILCSSPSKSFNIPGLQISNIIIPDDMLRSRFKKALKRNSILLPNIFSIKAVEAAYNESQDWLDQVIEYLCKNIITIDEFFKSELPNAKFINPEATYLGWINLKAYCQDHMKRRQLIIEKGRIAIDNGYIFGDSGKDFERINFACNHDVLIKGLERLAYSLK